MKKMSVQKLMQLSLLTAIALIIFVVELRIPNLLPIPGVKLGLANIITVYAIYRYSKSEVLLILTARIILGSIFSGNMMSIAYSLAGGFCCFLGMILLKKMIAEDYLWLASIGGAIFHNIGQIIIAIMFTGTMSILVYFPILFVTGSIAGFFTGFCALMIVKKLPMKNNYAKNV